jgi:hypothetical protein
MFELNKTITQFQELGNPGDERTEQHICLVTQIFFIVIK